MRMTICGAFASLLLVSSIASADDQECYSAALVPDGMSYHVRNGISAFGHSIKFVSLITATGQALEGRATFRSRAANGTTIKGLELSKIAVRHDSNLAPNRLVVRFADFGGGVNLRVNGASVVVGRFGELDGRQLGGASITVQESRSGEVRVGTLRLDGALSSFVVGGNSLLLEEACGSYPAVRSAE